MQLQIKLFLQHERASLSDGTASLIYLLAAEEAEQSKSEMNEN